LQSVNAENINAIKTLQEQFAQEHTELLNLSELLHNTIEIHTKETTNLKIENAKLFDQLQKISEFKNPENTSFSKLISLKETLQCPITSTVFIDPVCCSDGQTYEREAITKWLLKNPTSPLSRAPLLPTFYPNLLVKKMKESLS